MNKNWTFEWITDWNEIWSDKFISQWKVWLDQSWSGHVFFHPALVRAWVETYTPLRDINPLFLIARHGDITVFFPLVMWKRNWKNAFLREIIPVGFSDFDYHDPVVVGSEDDFQCVAFWKSLIAELKNQGITFDRINIAGITKRLAGQGNNWQNDEICPYCDIFKFTNPEQFLPTLKKKLRGNLRKRIRRLHKQGELTFHVYSGNNLAEALSSLPEFLNIHSMRWPNAYKAPHFHENLLTYGIGDNIVHFSELRLVGKPISWRLSFVDHQKLYSYFHTADPEFAKFSPGKVHLLKCVEDAIRLKLSIYDFLRGNKSYKSGWATNLIKLSKFALGQQKITSRVKCFMVEKVKSRLAPAA